MTTLRASFVKAGVMLGTAVAAAALAVACTEQQPTSPQASAKQADGFDKSSVLGTLVCNANLDRLEVSCDPPQVASTAGGSSSGKPSILLGGQNNFVKLTSTNVAYSGGTGAFTFDVTVRNLIEQTLGEVEGGGGLDANGVRVFFASGPTVTGGTGSITVNGDGTAVFDGGGAKPYYQYNQLLPAFQVSSAKTWNLTIQNTVTTFSFTLLVSASVKYPNGYIDLDVQTLVPPTDRQMSYTVRNANGTIDPNPGTINWSSDNTNVVEVSSTGLLNPLRAGTALITATAGGKVGTYTVNVLGITRTWLGGANTDWSNGANWSPDAIVPGTVDSVSIPAGTTFAPGLTSNVQVAGVTVANGQTLALNAFDLTASKNVVAGATGGISNTSGRLLLTGIAATVEGKLPVITVTGTYSMTNNVTARAPLRVDAGRLTQGNYRLQGDGN